jgi:hypothetical protein
MTRNLLPPDENLADGGKRVEPSGGKSRLKPRAHYHSKNDVSVILSRSAVEAKNLVLCIAEHLFT